MSLCTGFYRRASPYISTRRLIRRSWEAVQKAVTVTHLQLLTDAYSTASEQDLRALKLGLQSFLRAMQGHTAPPAEIRGVSADMVSAYRAALATAMRDGETATTSLLAFLTAQAADARDCISAGVVRVLGHLATLAKLAKAGAISTSLKVRGRPTYFLRRSASSRPHATAACVDCWRHRDLSRLQLVPSHCGP